MRQLEAQLIKPVAGSAAVSYRCGHADILLLVRRLICVGLG